VHPPFQLPCRAFGQQQASTSLAPKQGEGQQDLAPPQAPFRLSSLSASCATQGNRHKDEFALYSYEILSQSLLETGAEIGA